ncbi:hypothetical protein [Nocardia wallacei]|uniref:hypothetical protein n=1 Tax=Nocardia wallacei TaxID=480035 RepID=UPI0024566E84|nr:hypothetical protein [Nocardia wallacei]
MTSKKAVTHARRRAHEALAAQRLQRVEREKANEADLTAYLLLEAEIHESERTLCDAIAALRRKQGNHLQHWHARGENLGDISKLTNTTVAELRRLMKLSAEPSTGVPDGTST